MPAIQNRGRLAGHHHHHHSHQKLHNWVSIASGCLKKRGLMAAQKISARIFISTPRTMLYGVGYVSTTTCMHYVKNYVKK
jgi:hypothetical protein